MADNITLDSGSGGDTLGADEISSVKYQRVKLIQGADGTNDGDVAKANPLPIGANTAKDGSGTLYAPLVDADGHLQVDALSCVVTNEGTFAVQETGTVTVDCNSSNVTVDGVPAPLNVVGGGAEATALRVTLANDSTGVVSIDDGGNTITVDGTVTANAGTNLNTSALALESGGNLATIAGDTTSLDGKVTACNTGAVVISSGTVTTVSAVTAISNALPAGDNNIGNVDIVTLPSGNLGMQAMAASLSIVPASDITDGTYIGDIKFGEALPEGANAIGKLAENTGVDIGDVDVTSVVPGTGATNLGKVVDAVAGASDVGVATLAVRADTLSALTQAAADYVLHKVNQYGALYVDATQEVDRVFDGGVSCTVKRFNVVATADGDTIIAAPSGTKKIRVRSMAIVAMSATQSEVYFETGTTGTDTLGDSTNGFLVATDADGNDIAGVTLQYNPDGWFETADADETLKIKMSSNQPMIVLGTYIEVA